MNRIVQLDIHGRICPSCLLLTLKALNEHAAAIRTGEVDILVLTDDRQATATIPDAAGKMGFHAEVGPDDRGYRIHIHR